MLLQSADALQGSETIWLWIGTALMALGTAYFIAKGWGEDDERMQEFYIITIFIPAIAAVNYLAMALGFGVTGVEVQSHIAEELGTGVELVTTEEGTEVLPVYWARYSDWLFTTPLLLIDLALLADADRNTIYTLVGVDVIMIGTGLIATLSTTALGRLIWWAVSTGAFVVLLYLLLTTLTSAAQGQGEEVRSLFGTLRNLVLVLWTVYPILWLVGTEGAAIIGLNAETAVFMVIDVVAKVGFGIILLQSRTALQQAVGAPEVSAAD